MAALTEVGAEPTAPGEMDVAPPALEEAGAGTGALCPPDGRPAAEWATFVELAAPATACRGVPEAISGPAARAERGDEPI